MKKIKKGDDVIAITGKDKGKRGTVLRVVNESLVVVEGSNKVKKHTKADPNKGSAGGIIEIAKPIQISNIAVYNSATKKLIELELKL
jgi:large subunit ribosomal protein L24